MGMKKVYINSKKERLKEGKPCTLKINIKDANGNKTEVDVLVKKVELVDETASKYHASISGVTVTGKFHKKIGFESNEKVQLGSKNENNTKENCYKFCTRRERLRRRQLQYWDVIAPQLSVFSIAEFTGNYRSLCYGDTYVVEKEEIGYRGVPGDRQCVQLRVVNQDH